MTFTLVRKNLVPLIGRLHETYPEARYELNWENPLQLLVATILAAQATDERINELTPTLFARYADAQAFAEAERSELEEMLRPTGFYRNKARAVQEACQALVERFGGEVPRTMEEMLTLPGVARKTANVVLNNAFQIPSGIIVDTHVARVSGRLGLTTQTKPERIERELMEMVPRDEWIHFGPALVLHGRYTCTAHAPRCGDCILQDLCPKNGVEAPAAAATEAPRTQASPTKKSVSATSTAQPGLADMLPDDWRAVLADELTQPYFRQLRKFVDAERKKHTVYPPPEDMFRAFQLTPYRQVKVVLLGQDPYHDDGQAHGLCFSVRPGVKPPPSLVNIFKELQDDLGHAIPERGDLTAWANQGVLLLNTVLTVRAHEANSHRDQGWETFTDAVIRILNEQSSPLVFLLWGAAAQKKQQLIDTTRHRVLTAAHPSPLSAKKFFGSRPFSQANQALHELKREPIDWRLVPSTETASKTTVTAQAAPALAETETEAFVPPAAARLSRYSGHLAESWLQALADEMAKPYFRKLERLLDGERQAGTVYPAENEVFQAFALTPLEQVRVVILGEEPAALPGQAHGLAFSVPPDAPLTPALGNLFQELRRDLGCWISHTGCLAPWARQGVLLLNTVLTVRANEPRSHQNHGWQMFTDAVLQILNNRSQATVFLLCGAAAEGKKWLLDPQRHTIVTVADPAEERFLGSRPFSAINNALELQGDSAIYWQLFAL